MLAKHKVGSSTLLTRSTSFLIQRSFPPASSISIASMFVGSQKHLRRLHARDEVIVMQRCRRGGRSVFRRGRRRRPSETVSDTSFRSRCGFFGERMVPTDIQ